MADSFAQRLRELRMQKKLTQTDLGQITGLHYNHIGRYERGGSRPTADALQKLADALGVSGDYLLNGVVQEAAKARFEDRELLRRFQEVQTLPEDDKVVVIKLLDAFIAKRQIQALVSR